MKKSLEHLPQNKADELELIRDKIIEFIIDSRIECHADNMTC